MLKKSNQKGFTLIEIIAVLVILGILAAVAIPKFFDLQDESRMKSQQGALAAGQSQLAMQYARNVLNNPGVASNWNWSTAGFDLGDFKATLNGACGVNASFVTLTSGPWTITNTNGAGYKNFTICQ